MAPGGFFSSFWAPRTMLERGGICFTAGAGAGAGAGVGEGCAGDSAGPGVLPLILLGVEASRGFWLVGSGLLGGDEAFHFAELCLVNLSADSRQQPMLVYGNQIYKRVCDVPKHIWKLS